MLDNKEDLTVTSEPNPSRRESLICSSVTIWKGTRLTRILNSWKAAHRYLAFSLIHAFFRQLRKNQSDAIRLKVVRTELSKFGHTTIHALFQMQIPYRLSQNRFLVNVLQPRFVDSN